MRPANAFVAAMFGSVLLVCGPASAADPEPPTRIVSYADLDLSRAADMSTLRTRIMLAAEKVCQLRSLRESPLQRRIAERCVANAMSKAVDQIAQRRAGEKNGSELVGAARPASSLGQNPLD